MKARRPPRPAPELPGNLRAKQRAAVVLAVLSGDCAIAEAGRRLNVSPTRYYGLERQALIGLVRALEEPAERQRPATLARTHVRLEQEVLRLQALVRATQKAVALPPPPKAPARRKVAPRARKVIAQLRMPTEAPATAPEQE